ncbi:hypothetical protein GO009_01030 [Muricauda sp. TY007]|nr:hypothetical protein [Muricauda sp. TY007]
MNKDHAFFILMLLVFSLPFELIFSTIAMVILVLALLISYKWKEVVMPDFHNSYLFLFYFILSFVGVFYSENPVEATDRIVRKLPMLIFPLAVLVMSLRVEQRKTLQKVFVWSCTLFCILSIATLLYNFWAHNEYSHHYNFAQSSMYHFHFPYDTLYLNTAYIFLLFGNYGNLLKKILSLLFFTVIFLFGVRIGIATFFLITAVYVVLNIKKLITLRNVAFFGLSILLAFFLINSSSYLKDKYFGVLEKVGLVSSESISEIGEDYHNLSLREDLWLNSFETIKKRPVFGYGTYGEVEYLKNQYQNSGMDKKNMKLNSHNQYLTTFLQYGIFGGGILLLILLRSLYIAIKGKNIQGALFVIICMIAFMTESYLIRQKGIMLFTLFICLFIEENVFKQKQPVK